MKGHHLALAALVAAVLAAPAFAELKPGNVELKAPGALAFGSKNVLFVADLGGNPSIYAIDTRDEGGGDRNAPLNVEGINTKLAEMIGTAAKEIRINDMKVNPATGNVFLSVARTQGGGMIAKVDRGGKVSEVGLKDVPMAQLALSKTPSKPNLRNPVVTSLAFSNNRLYIAGMANEEFNSSFRSIEFPFKDADQITGVEIFHGAHGKWETASPVRTFTPFDINGQAHILAAYTCTPLVKFNITDLKAGEKVKGTTVAELGNMNQPLDMVVYKKDGKTFILIANTRRGVMKVTTEGVESVEAITTPVRGGGTAGLKYDTIKELTGVTQLDKLSDTQALVLVDSKDVQSLKTVDLP